MINDHAKKMFPDTHEYRMNSHEYDVIFLKNEASENRRQSQNHEIINTQIQYAKCTIRSQ